MVKPPIDVSAWLTSVNLGEYAARFSENRIGWDILPDLKEADLEALGLPLGDRKRLLKAIEAVAAQSHYHGSIASTGGHSPASAERRQITVLFCDLCGSTALATQLDPEDLRDVVRRYHECCAEMVRRHDGSVAQYLGDGVMVRFGYPLAHEDDAERALQCGLRLITAVNELPMQGAAQLQVRIGIATGIVVVGDQLGIEPTQERSAVGVTPSLASRLQGLAEPGTVLIDSHTRRLVGDMFEFRDVGTINVKGFAEPMSAHQVIRPSGAQNRFEALRTASLSDLVGRGEELDLLLRRWDQARKGGGRAILISGEPGIGKSRMIAALLERIREPHVHMRYFSSPHHEDSALYPIIANLERVAGFLREDDTKTKLEKLGILLDRTATSPEDVALLAELFSLTAADSRVIRNLTSRQRKEKTLAALLRQLEVIACEQPIVMVFEDLHWIDPTSRELVDLVIRRLPTLPLLLIMTFRPEFEPHWIGQAHVSLLALNRLEHKDAIALVRRLASESGLSSEILEEIVERSDGVPLFLEELSKSVAEAARAGEAVETAVAAGSPQAIPSTLYASLMARLDRLGSAKAVAQVGAAIGREFSYELISAVLGGSDADLCERLQRLVHAELVFCRGAPPNATFLFKHALVQDAAYGTLLRKSRQELHARIAAVLAEQFPEITEGQPELLAYHFARAGHADAAVKYWRRAADRSLSRSAMREAIAQLNKSVEQLAEIPADRSRDELELELQLALGTAHAAASGYAASAVVEAYARSRVLCERLGDSRRLYAALVGQYVHQFISAERGVALQTALEILKLSEGDQEPGRRASGHRLAGMSLYMQGCFEPAEGHLHSSLFGDDVAEQPPSARSVQDGRVTGLMFHAAVLYELGRIADGHAARHAGMSRARSLRHPYTLAFALGIACHTHLYCDHDIPLLDCAEELVTLCSEHGFAYFGAMGLIHRARAMAQNGVSTGLSELEHGIALYRDTGANWSMPCYLGILASHHGYSGQPERGLVLIEQALEQADRADERCFESALHCISGRLSLDLRRIEEAERAFTVAIERARMQRGKLWELRAAIDLSKLYIQTGEGGRVGNLLGPLVEAFADDKRLTDLTTARNLLSF